MNNQYEILYKNPGVSSLINGLDKINVIPEEVL